MTQSLCWTHSDHSLCELGQPRLSLIDTGATLFIIDEKIAHKLHLLPLKGPSVHVNRVGHNRSLGFTTLAFLVQGRRDVDPVLLCSSADFHVLSDFGPGILLGLDIICSAGLVINISSGRAHIQDVSFPIYNSKGKTMSSKNVSRTLVVQNTSTILPHSHSFVQVCHNLLHNVQYTVDSSLWSTPDSSGLLVVPSAILDHNNTGLWVSNFGSTPVNISSDTRLADAIPLSPDDVAISSGFFCPKEVITNPVEAIEWDCINTTSISKFDIANKLAEVVDSPTSRNPDHCHRVCTEGPVQKDLKQASGVNNLIRQVVHINCEINHNLGF
ncbi:uncharacterized protein UDID_17686 [Ustilago sp. UG-2017a]|nr:uncharacterized protein UDID_17686 [Ustilago sp. UG-2017a]